MPSRTLLLCAVIGLAVVVVLVGSGLFVSRDAHLVLNGEMQKIRTAAMEPTRSVLIVDFRVTNPAGYPFQVKSADLVIVTADDRTITGQAITEGDSKMLFQAYPLLGEKYNQSIGYRERIASKQTVDRMAAASFDLSEESLQHRKSLTLRLKDADGPVSELHEKR